MTDTVVTREDVGDHSVRDARLGSTGRGACVRQETEGSENEAFQSDTDEGCSETVQGDAESGTAETHSAGVEDPSAGRRTERANRSSPDSPQSVVDDRSSVAGSPVPSARTGDASVGVVPRGDAPAAGDSDEDAQRLRADSRAALLEPVKSKLKAKILRKRSTVAAVVAAATGAADEKTAPSPAVDVPSQMTATAAPCSVPETRTVSAQETRVNMSLSLAQFHQPNKAPFTPMETAVVGKMFANMSQSKNGIDLLSVVRQTSYREPIPADHFLLSCAVMLCCNVLLGAIAVGFSRE